MAPVFTLQAVLTLRLRDEEAKERSLAAIATERQRIRSTRDRVRAELQHWTSERLQSTGDTALSAVQHASYARLKALQDAHQQLEAQLDETEARYRAQQTAYLAARRARETLEELKKQQHRIHEVAAKRRDQKMLDDLFTTRRWTR